MRTERICPLARTTLGLWLSRSTRLLASTSKRLEVAASNSASSRKMRGDPERVAYELQVLEL
jgi:hypothetical protein